MLRVILGSWNNQFEFDVLSIINLEINMRTALLQLLAIVAALGLMTSVIQFWRFFTWDFTTDFFSFWRVTFYVIAAGIAASLAYASHPRVNPIVPATIRTTFAGLQTSSFRIISTWHCSQRLA